MKKLPMIVIAWLSAAIFANAQDHSLASSDKLVSAKPASKFETTIETPSKSIDVNDRIVKKFKKEFPGAMDAVWVQTKNGFIVRFISNGIQNWTFLNKGGNRLSTMRYYTETELPSDVRTQVKSTYFDFSISSVKEVNCNNLTAYLITIEDKTKWKVIRVVDGEMDVWEEHQKKL